MKIIITETTKIEFDPEKERESIRANFSKKEYVDSLIKVIDEFEQNGFDAAYAAYEALPYNDEEEYPLQESMGIWWWNLGGEMLYGRDSAATISRKMEIIK